MTEAVYAIWDAETTGTDVFEDRIVQFFFATSDKAGNLIDSTEWFVNPGIPVPQGASDVHGLTDEFLELHGRDPAEALEEIRATFASNLKLTHVAFNMSFDLSILDAEFKRHGASTNFGEYMRDNVKLADGIVLDRHFDKYRKGKRTLEAQARHYGVPFDPDEAHSAVYDTEVTAKVTVAIIEKFGLPSVAQQSEMYYDWAQGLEKYLRKTDPAAEVSPQWPLRLKEEA